MEEGQQKVSNRKLKREQKKLKQKEYLKNQQQAQQNKIQGGVKSNTSFQRSKETQHDIKPEFIQKNPFRFVKKYKYKFDTYAKKRWIGMKIIDLMVREFSSFSSSYYESAIKAGNITVNKGKITSDYILQNTDFIEHYTIRLEPPILNIVPKIIHEDEEILIVDKPPSVLCHPGAGSNFNTLQGLLIHELGCQKKMNFVNRLDKFTSGLVLLSKGKMDTCSYHLQEIEEKEKKYLARVYGEFPDDKDIKVEKALYCNDQKLFHFATCEPEEEEKLNAKKSATIFNRIWYDEKSNTSLVECVPLTGRTHQIRVHLSHLGFPILNDLHYGGKFVGNLIVKHLWPEVYDDKEYNNIKYTDADPEALEEFKKCEKNEDDQSEEDIKLKSMLKGYVTQGDMMSQYNDQIENANKKKLKISENEGVEVNSQQEQQINNSNNEKAQQKLDEKNSQLEKEIITKDDQRFNDLIQWKFRDHVLELYLHSYQYKIKNQTFKTEEPYWASKDLEFLEGFK